MEQDKTQLVELFIDCIDKRRFVSQISSKKDRLSKIHKISTI